MASRRGTGPRTRIGKERTKYNSLKDGLFAKVVLLSHEPQSQFDDLHHGLQDYFMPEGMLEAVLVEKLATILWRYRRFLQVESAVVQNNIEQQEDEDSGLSRRALRWQAILEKDTAERNREGAVPEIEDYAESLEYCLDHLDTLRENADKYGLDYESNSIHLGLIYGARYSGRPGRDLFDFYLECLGALKATATERQRRGFESEVDCVQKFIAETEKEMRRLEGHRKRPIQKPKQRPLTDEDQPRGTSLLKWEIPDSDELDRLLRCEASLERALDRTLSQLERLQRMRLGQSVPPKLEVQHLLS